MALTFIYKAGYQYSTCGQSLVAFSIMAALGFLMSSGDNCGRSTVIVNSFSLPVKRDGQRYDLHFSNSISPGRQLLLNHGSSGP
jgi:hypothetical protein